jgi:hypothetical protein
VCADKADVSDPQWVIELDDQSVFITRNIESHSVAFKNACVAKLLLDLMGADPICIFRYGVPRLHGFLAVAVVRNSPKFPDRFPGDDPQSNSSESL